MRLSYAPLGTFRPCFGELSLLCGGRRAATVAARTDGALWRLGRRAFLAMVANPTGAAEPQGAPSARTKGADATAGKLNKPPTVGLPSEVMEMVMVQLEHEVLLDQHNRKREHKQAAKAATAAALAAARSGKGKARALPNLQMPPSKAHNGALRVSTGRAGTSNKQ